MGAGLGDPNFGGMERRAADERLVLCPIQEITDEGQPMWAMWDLI